MNANAGNLVRNGDFELCEWDYRPGYPQVQMLRHRGRSAMYCRGDADDVLLRQTVGHVEPGHYLASFSFASDSVSPPHQLLMRILLDGVSDPPEIRIALYDEQWEGHWVEFDVPNRASLEIQITSSTDGIIPGNDLIFSDIAVRRLGDLD